MPPKRHCELVPAVTWASVPDAFVYSGPPFDVNDDNVRPEKVGDEPVPML